MTATHKPKPTPSAIRRTAEAAQRRALKVGLQEARRLVGLEPQRRSRSRALEPKRGGR